MDYRIDKNGILWAQRRGGFVKQFCKYRQGIFCSDSCPSFDDIDVDNGTLRLCDDLVLTGEFDLPDLTLKLS